MLDTILKSVDLSITREIRIRAGQPVKVLDYQWKYLSSNGAVVSKNEALVLTREEIEEIVYLACEKSVYAYNDKIIGGYLTVEKGIRIGVCGKVTMDKDKVLSIHQYSSLVVRIPHEIKGCAKEVVDEITSPLKSCLIVSPPSAGKTTLIRDAARILGGMGYNCLICDEREEIASVKSGVSSYDLPNCDIYSGCSKNFCFSAGLRSCSPDVIICDEILKDEIDVIANAVYGGVKVIGTLHGESQSDVEKKGLSQIFDKFVFLSNKRKVGEVVKIVDREK